MGQKLQTEHKWGQDFQTIKQQGSEISVLNEQRVQKFQMSTSPRTQMGSGNPDYKASGVRNFRYIPLLEHK